MKRIFILLLTTILFSLSGNAQSNRTGLASKAIQVQFNKNVELLGLAYFVGYEGPALEGETDSIVRKREIDKYAYSYYLYQQYKHYQNSENLAVVINSAYTYNLFLDYMSGLLVKLDDFPHATLTDDVEEKHYIRFSHTKNPAEAKANATLFIEAFNRLYKEINFDVYLQKNSSRYTNALEQVKSVLPSGNFIPAMESFYRQGFTKYILVPSLTIPAGMGFGMMHQAKGKTHIYNIFGAFDRQNFLDEKKLDMGFANEKRNRELSTHEFGHSFVNPVIDQLPEELISKTQHLYVPLQEVMTQQGYPTWKYCLDEHFVRAGEVMVARSLGNTKDAEDLQDHYVEERKFIYLPIIIKELEAYSQNHAMPYREAVDKAMKQLSKRPSYSSGNTGVKQP
jgi:hypothetical protein